MISRIRVNLWPLLYKLSPTQQTRYAHHLRRWPNINSALVQRLVFAGYECYLIQNLASNENFTHAIYINNYDNLCYHLLFLQLISFYNTQAN